MNSAAACSPLVAVTGGTGFVGRFVVERLLAEGCRVRVLTRGGPGSGALGGAERLRGDIVEESAVARLVAGADAVVHCAYQHAPGRYRGGEADDRFGYWRANLLAGVELMERARGAGVGRLVLLSSRAVFGRGSPSPSGVDDDTRPVPDTLYGAMKLALEAHATALSAADGVCYASLRPTGVYGLATPPANSKWFDIACAVRACAVRDSAAAENLPPRRQSTEVHGRDVAAAVWLLLNAPAPAVAGRTFNCSDVVVDNHVIATALAERAAVRLASAGGKVPAPSHPMRTPGLRALGWRPGGEVLLAETLDALAAAAARHIRANAKPAAGSARCRERE